ncbi:hypothetical protein F0562_003315 [Nyssa sinensis]|uniref:Uncharacterized protein n=1 Tax=Nyssa sinensis TaxID=561372 RepID=A0A5J5BW25_9ASTE|nr:hypothetical protein F0562_003315 [Nyssa sinensis]
MRQRSSLENIGGEEIVGVAAKKTPALSPLTWENIRGEGRVGVEWVVSGKKGGWELNGCNDQNDDEEVISLESIQINRGKDLKYGKEMASYGERLRLQILPENDMRVRKVAETGNLVRGGSDSGFGI